MGDTPDDSQTREEYLTQRKQMVGWLKSELGIEINSGGLADRIVRWAKVSSLLTKMSNTVELVGELMDREL